MLLEVREVLDMLYGRLYEFALYTLTHIGALPICRHGPGLDYSLIGNCDVSCDAACFGTIRLL